jgi:uncharacterized membrane protein
MSTVSLFEAIRHPHVHHRKKQGPVKHRDHLGKGVNARIAAWITSKIGSMATVYVCIVFFGAWMVLARTGPLNFDQYPFPFLLFLGNVVQLLLIFVILLGQKVLGQAADGRATQTYEDAEAILHDCQQIQAHLIAQDDALRGCLSLDPADEQALIGAAQRLDSPPQVGDEHIGFNGRLAAWITNKVSTMGAFYAACLIQFGWMVLGETGVISFDPYPFAFLLFLSSLAQLLLMFIIMVGQQVLGRAADKRALATYLDAEAVLHACERLQAHLRIQDVAIRHVITHVNQCRAEHAPVRLLPAGAGSLDTPISRQSSSEPTLSDADVSRMRNDQ